jgi:lysophospholipase L1-like esterase
MVSRERRVNCSTRSADGWLAGSVLLALISLRPFCASATDLAAPMPVHVVREETEWLDVWLPHSTDRSLPHVLLIGDSITRGYGPGVEKALAGRAYVGRLATSKSLGDPAYLEEVALILRSNSVDVIHFNNGLHGAGYTEQQYASAIPRLLKVFRRYAPSAQLVWANCTDALGSGQPMELTPARIGERNRLAAAQAASHGIAMDDLFSVVKDHADYHVADGIHFTAAGYGILAAHVAKTIQGVLDEPPRSPRP